MNIEIVWKGQNALGEGPICILLKMFCIVFDIAKPFLHRLNPVSGDYQSWEMPDFIGAVVLRKKRWCCDCSRQCSFWSGNSFFENDQACSDRTLEQ